MSASRALRALQQLGNHLQEWVHEREIAQKAIEVIESELGYENAAVLAISRTDGQLNPLALSDQGQGREFVEQDREFVESCELTWERGLTGWVARAGESVCVGDVLEDPRYFALREDIRSELCVPLRVRGVVIGVLNTETTSLNAYSETDRQFLEVTGNHLALALDGARLLGLLSGGAQR